MRKLFTLAIVMMAALVLAGTPAMAQQCSGGVCQTCAGGDNDGGACTSNADCPNGGVCDPGGPDQCAVAGQPANTFRVTADIATSTLWTADTEYILTRPIFVLDGATLSIEAGTVIRGEGESAAGNLDPGTLIGARGSKIRMAGSKTAPIVMTDCSDDNVGGSMGTAPYDNAANAQSLEGRWGGLIMLGYGYVGENTAGAIDPTAARFIEGLEATPNGQYGGCSDFLSAPFDRNCDDGDSGLINYTTLRYGGFNIAAGNEINGLTLGGVGRNTEIDFIEVYQNQDDGIEWFGGSANVSHAVVVAVGDDTFDYDQGWRGKGQFWFAVQGEAGNEQSDKGGEWDGGDSPDSSLPFSLPTIANMTQIGLGAAGVCLVGGESCFVDADCPLGGDTCSQWAAQNDNTGLHIRDNAGGRVFNSFMGDFGGAVACLEGAPGAAGTPGDNWDDAYTANGVEFVEFELGTNELDLDQNTFWCYQPGQDLPDGAGTGAAFNCGGGTHYYPTGLPAGENFYDKNDYLACGTVAPIQALNRAPATLSNPGRVTTIDPRPTEGGQLLTGGTFSLPNDGFFQEADYRGAFAFDKNWATGWSTASRLGLIPACSDGVCRTCAGGDNDGGACSSDGDCPNGGICDPGGPGQCAVDSSQPDNTFRVTSDIAESTTWSKHTEYILTKPIFVLDGATLTIEAGTVIRGEGESAAGNLDPGTLIAARGGKINATGTAHAPIVFTDCEDDNFGDNPGTAPYDTAANAQTLEGRWGGVIMLGYGYVGENTAGAVDPTAARFIEGLEATPNGQYGGCDDFLTGPFDRNCDDGDSGTLTYVSARYGGFNIAAGNEINGLTLGGVGRDTLIDFVEIYQNQDDGIEWFGGAANVSHAVVMSVGDDTFDYDQGWRGKGQFWFAVQGEAGNEQSDKGGEWDGGDSPDSSLPFSLPSIFNMTQVGLGAAGVCLIGGESCFVDADCPLGGDTCSQWAAQNDNTGLHIRDNAGGRVFNSFMGDFGGAVACIEGAPGAAGTPGDNWDDPYTANGIEFVEFENGTNELDLDQNTFWCYEPGQDLPDGAGTGAAFNCGGGTHYFPPDFYTKNEYLACGTAAPIRVLDRAAATLSNPGRVIEIDPRPASGSSLLTGSTFTIPNDGFYDTSANYRGAFSAEDNWASKWTTASRLGALSLTDCSGGVCRTCSGGDNDGGACTADGDCPNGGVCDPGDVDFCEVDGDGDSNDQPNGTFRVTADIAVSTTWTNDTDYILTRPIFVLDGATLTIEAGTVIRGEGESAAGNLDPGTLIAARGGVINANGTEANPIVFTDCSDDNVQGNPNPTAPYDTVQNARTLEGRWGGLIMLGYGYVGENTAGAVDPTAARFIEGLEATPNGQYGGCDDFLSAPFDRNCDDGNSGNVNYVSLRYGGFNIAAGNEINGLTLGGVGRNTNIDYVEVYQNQDDGIEWFGGAANVSHAIVIGVGDDSFDFDQGWRGNGQFWLQLQGESGNEQSDKGGEWDGGDSPDGSEPNAMPTIANMTAVGLGGGGVCLIGGEACFVDADCPTVGDTCSAWAARADNTGLHIRDNAGVLLSNSIMADFGGAVACLEGAPGAANTPGDKWDNAYNTGFSADTDIYLPRGIASNELDIRDNEFYCYGGGQDLPDGAGTGAAFNCGGGTHYFPPDFYSTAGNSYNACGDPLPFTELDRDAPTLSNPGAVNSFDPRLAEEPTEASACPAIQAPAINGFFKNAPYKGAMSFGTNWGACWSTAAGLGLFPTCDSTTGVGAEPNEVGETLFFVNKTDFVWVGASCNVDGYDALRSSDASDFSAAQGVTPGECGDNDTNASDAQTPAAGSAFFYLVRGTNTCGDGSLGQNNATCGERTGPATCF